MDSKSANSSGPDRRSVPRFSPNPATSCQARSAAGSDSQPATIHNISAGGIKLAVQRPPEVGASLVLVLTNEAGPFMQRIVTVRVTHVMPQSDGSYALGCAFQAQLTGHELLALAL
ncbi:MAG TPA: PilZ domain-containing protein [Gemmataceae bacterium]|jgi:hypothetical protein|nr:PilZ domain-containing protein [Gemmataceae bacterium]